MRAISQEDTFLGVFIGGMIIVMYFSQIWYLIPFLIGIFFTLWRYGKTHCQYGVAALFCGEICSVLAWYSSPWLSWIIQVAVLGLFMNYLKITVIRQEKTVLIILSCSLAVITFIADQVNHTAIPVFVIIGLSLLAVLFSIIAEYQLQKKFSGGNI